MIADHKYKVQLLHIPFSAKVTRYFLNDILISLTSLDVFDIVLVLIDSNNFTILWGLKKKEIFHISFFLLFRFSFFFFKKFLKKKKIKIKTKTTRKGLTFLIYYNILKK